MRSASRRLRWALLTVFEDVGVNLVDAHLVQLFIGLNAPAGAPAGRADLARLIVACNTKIAVGQFAFREEAGVMESDVLRRGPPGLAGREPQQTVQPPFAARHEERILHHGQEGGGQGQGEAEPNLVASQVLHDPDERKVGLDDRLVEPVLLEEVFVLGVPYEGKMGVENQTPESPGIRRRFAFNGGRDRRLRQGLAPSREAGTEDSGRSGRPSRMVAGAFPLTKAPPHDARG